MKYEEAFLILDLKTTILFTPAWRGKNGQPAVKAAEVVCRTGEGLSLEPNQHTTVKASSQPLYLSLSCKKVVDFIKFDVY